jgi:predicted sulfurtransferase
MDTNKNPVLLLSAVIVLGVLACNAFLLQMDSQAGLPQTEEEVPRISVQDAWAAFEEGAAVIVDVRSAESYAAGHILGAISIPLDEFENNLPGIPLEKDQWIITYCT